MRIGFTHDGKEFLASNMTPEQFNLVQGTGFALSRVTDLVDSLQKARLAFLEKRISDGGKHARRASRLMKLAQETIDEIFSRKEQPETPKARIIMKFCNYSLDVSGDGRLVSGNLNQGDQ